MRLQKRFSIRYLRKLLWKVSTETIAPPPLSRRFPSSDVLVVGPSSWLCNWWLAVLVRGCGWENRECARPSLFSKSGKLFSSWGSRTPCLYVYVCIVLDSVMSCIAKELVLLRMRSLQLLSITSWCALYRTQYYRFTVWNKAWTNHPKLLRIRCTAAV